MKHIPRPPRTVMRRTVLAGLVAAAGFGLGSFATPAAAQAWPNKVIHLLVPAGVGTVSDMVARLLAPQMGKTLGQNIVVENNAAAGGVPGTQQLVRAPKDGYTIAVLNNNHVVNPSIYKDLSFVHQLNAALKAALATKEVQEAMAKLDVRTTPGTPEQATQFFQTELDKHTSLAKKGMATMD